MSISSFFTRSVQFPGGVPLVLDVPSLSCGELIHHLVASIPAILPGLLDPVVLVGRLVGPPLLLPGVDLHLLLVHPVRHALNRYIQRREISGGLANWGWRCIKSGDAQIRERGDPSLPLPRSFRSSSRTRSLRGSRGRPPVLLSAVAWRMLAKD